MLLLFIVNRFICLCKKTARPLFFIILSGLFSLPSYAEIPIENKVRNAVVNQLILMGGKGKAEVEQETKRDVSPPAKETSKEASPATVAVSPPAKEASKEASSTTVAVSPPAKESSKEASPTTVAISPPAKETSKEASPTVAAVSQPVVEKKKKVVLKKASLDVAVSKEKKQVTASKAKEKASKATEKKALALNDTKKEQSTPVVETLTEKELESLMQDVMRVSGKTETSKNTAIKSAASEKEKESETKVASKEKTDNEKNKSSANNDKSESVTAKKETSEPTKKEQQATSEVADNKTKKTASSSEPKAIPVGRIQLGRNIDPAATTVTASKTVATTAVKTTVETSEQSKGWIYLGQFKSNEWQNPTLKIKKQLPTIGERYSIIATMVNVRDGLPKKGVMGKAMKALKNKETVKILQLRSLGRNRLHYWANIEYK